MKFEGVSKILDHPTDDLVELAKLVSPCPKTFYVGADFMKVDLRGTDLEGFALNGSRINPNLVDENTVLPEGALAPIYWSKNQEDYQSLREKINVSATDLFVKSDPVYLREIYPLEANQQLGPFPFSVVCDLNLNGWNGLNIELKDDPFSYDDRSSDWLEIVNEASEAFKSSRSIFDQGYKLNLVDIARDSNEIIVQRCLSSQACESNLIADYLSKSSKFYGQSIRKILLEEYPKVLPPFRDRRLLNQISACALVYCHDKEGVVQPVPSVLRRRQVLLNDFRMHCTSIWTLDYEPNDDNISMTDLIDRQAYMEVCSELGIKTNELELCPVAIVRDHARLGKPIIFYAGYTEKLFEEILEIQFKQLNDRDISYSVFDDQSKMDYEEFAAILKGQNWRGRNDIVLAPEFVALLYYIETRTTMPTELFPLN